MLKGLGRPRGAKVPQRAKGTPTTLGHRRHFGTGTFSPHCQTSFWGVIFFVGVWGMLKPIFKDCRNRE